MEGINQNQARIGSFTSSNIYKLLAKNKKGDGFGAPALEYIADKNMERRLKLSLANEVDSKETLWGTLVERKAFNILGLDYNLTSNVTLTHPTIPFWAGSRDGAKFDGAGKVETVIDIKCPFTRKSFCQLVDTLGYNNSDPAIGGFVINSIRENHKSGEQYYWQLVSNACISDCNFAELIVYCPYKSELSDIRKLANEASGEGDKFKFLNYAYDENLPYLLDGGYYSNVNIIRFQIPEADKILLTNTVIEAGKLLITKPA